MTRQSVRQLGVAAIVFSVIGVVVGIIVIVIVIMIMFVVLPLVGVAAADSGVANVVAVSFSGNRNFRSHVLSLPGAKVPWMELSLPGTFVPWNSRFREQK